MSSGINPSVKAIMVISPLDTFRMAQELLLQRNGFAVCAGIRNIEGFRHALNACKNPPNVILLDYWLSGPVTIEFIRSLKKQRFAVILMGTQFLGKDIAMSENIGFIEKPFTQLELQKVIQKVRA